MMGFSQKHSIEDHKEKLFRKKEAMKREIIQEMWIMELFWTTGRGQVGGININYLSNNLGREAIWYVF